MDLDLTSNQELLRDTTVRFIESTFPLTAVRELADHKAPLDPSYWPKAAELGWFSMLVPEGLDGGNVSGNGMVDAALIAYARGSLLQPGPFVGTNVVAFALAEAGSPDQVETVLPGLLSGQTTAAWAGAEPERWDSGGSVRAERHGRGYRLSGSTSLVQGAGQSDWVLVTATAGDGPAQFLLPAGSPGMTVRPLAGLDVTRTFGEVAFDGAEVPSSAIVGEVGNAGDLVDRQLQIACVLTVAESTGAMDHDLWMAVQYAKDRTAFGRPIGSFQAIKHLLADTSLLLEFSKGLAAAAARAVGLGRDDAAELASMAKAFVADCGVDLAQNCFQVFGGIGYTWEHDQHLYLRRLTVDAALYGDASWHRERICQMAGL